MSGIDEVEIWDAALPTDRIVRYRAVTEAPLGTPLQVRWAGRKP
jgi:hypothetical protein